MKKNTKSICMLFASASLILLTGCKKEDKGEDQKVVSQQDIINSISVNVNAATYLQLANNSSELYDAIVAFTANPSEQGLKNCQALWKAARSTWEQSEGFLYGPVASDNIDPRIDTWPVNFVDLNAEMAGSQAFTESYVDGLDDALKGFHPIEFLLWGENGTKTYNTFTAREKEYLVALGKNLKVLTSELASQWNINNSASFMLKFRTPGANNEFYATKKEVYLEMVNAMEGICDEVASGKIGEPFIAQDPSLEESPYSKNSISDFKDNIKSIQNVYLGKFNADGAGLEDLVRKYNLSLDAKIKLQIAGAINSLTNITDPFGTAISSQATLVQNAITAINTLKTTLEDELLPFVNLYVTE